MPSISFRKSSSMTNIKHNNRVRQPKNANPERSENNVYFSRNIAEVYEEIFSAAVAEYNENQNRSDRRIDDYYKKTLHDKKTKEQQELIIQVGDMFDAQNVENWEKFEDILISYVNEFVERNPNLALYNAALHVDEATPHLHLNFVPYADYEKGLKRRVNFEKALKQQGFNSFADWRMAETGFIEKLMNEKGLVRDKVGSHKYAKIDEYKAISNEVELKYQKEIEQLKNENRSLKEENKSLRELFQQKVKEEVEKVRLELHKAVNFFEWGKKTKNVWEQYQMYRFEKVLKVYENDRTGLREAVKRQGLEQPYQSWKNLDKNVDFRQKKRDFER